MSESNKAIVRRLYERVWSLGELDVLEEVVSGDFVGHRWDRPDDLGREALRQSVITLCEAFPDGKFTIEDMVGERDRVAVRYTARATHKRTFPRVGSHRQRDSRERTRGLPHRGRSNRGAMGDSGSPEPHATTTSQSGLIVRNGHARRRQIPSLDRRESWLT